LPVETDELPTISDRPERADTPERRDASQARGGACEASNVGRTGERGGAKGPVLGLQNAGR